MEGPVRDMLMIMVDWHVGAMTDFTASTGKGGKDLQKHLDADTWDKLIQTYPDGDYQNIWTSLFAMCELFEELSKDTAEKVAVPLPDYPHKVLPYLHEIQKSSSV